ncbi:ABC transporter ATP-binding protein [Natranaerofaba carboxydovora]|uniref:ABC transporter ATP-binding protein n=1 Tax=Natranaerofaba carboxydovora TaxID=2742683 RepID=UPI001F13E539|nr:ABC transporter ATP-binding protein [Natranaerofaba carboxydovora]UMZ74310.1 Putative multidrug export ATP-binding/permease protein [Natranaerofaba carboxydovora]
MKSEKRVITNLLEYIKMFWPPFVGAFLFLGLSVVLSLVPPWLIQYGVDNIIAEGNRNLLVIFALIMIAVSLIKGIVDFLQRYLAELASQRVIHRLRSDLYSQLNRLSFFFYDEKKTGDIMSRLTSDTETLRRFFSFVSINIVANIATIFGVLIILFIWDYRLAMMYILMLPLMFHAMKKYANKVSPVYKQSRKRLASLTDNVQETFSKIETVKLLGGESYEEELFDKENNGYREANINASKISAFWMPYVHFLLGLATSLVIFIGGLLAIRGEVTIGILLGFTSYLAILTRPIRQTGMMINLVSRAIAGGERIFELLEEEPDIKDKPDATPLPPIKGKVEYQKVSFSYTEDNKILRDISFAAQPGETIAIVGPTGAGKTSLIHLLPRFYDPIEGNIYIDGYNIKDVTISSLRNQIGIIMQHDMLFSTSIKNNISYGNPDATDEEITHCAKLARIHDFVTSLPEGYETQVGEKGVKLSGGEIQRVIIARLLLQDPGLIIMDESTSNLDEKVEEDIQKAFRELFNNRTVFVIAHRLWTIKEADKILVIKDGVLAEYGTHEELLSYDSGIYKNMIKEGIEV